MLSVGAHLSSGNMKISGHPSEPLRVSMSSSLSSSNLGSGQEENDALGDVFLWGQGLGDGYLGGGVLRCDAMVDVKMDALLPKALDSSVMLDIQSIACGRNHASLVTKQGEVFSWGEESGGRLGHGVDIDVPHPKLVEALTNIETEFVACGEFHSCAVSINGDLYTWGDGTHNLGLLGHGNDISHWMPKQVNGILQGVRVTSIACGPWHTALVTSIGQLFTFGDGTFGVLGHNDTKSAYSPREVESLKGLKTVRAACGVWHTAAVVEVMVGYSSASSCSSGKLFTWGNGDKGSLGHGDKEQRLVPTCVAALVDYNFKQVSCGHSLTVALTTSGQVFTMGSKDYGQLGDPQADGNFPGMVEGKLWEVFVEEIACGSHHVAVLTHKTEVYTWGKGLNGRLGHGDDKDRYDPTLVEALKGKQVKSIACGSCFTAAVCLHKWVSGTFQSFCTGCKLPFGFTRKRHNCYNCGLVFCHPCSPKKALKASLAPFQGKPYRVCDSCYIKLKKIAEAGASDPSLGARKPSLKNLKSKDTKEKLENSKPHLEPGKSLDAKAPSKRPKKSDIPSSRVSPAPWGSVNVPQTFNSGYYQPKIMPTPNNLPNSQPKNISRSASPLSRRPSPPRSSTPTPSITSMAVPRTITDALKRTNDALRDEVLKLRAQVETLNYRFQNQEKDLHRASQQAQDALAMAGEETAKSRAAKEVIKSLTAQLRDMAERLPPGAIRRPGLAPAHLDIPNGRHPMPDLPNTLDADRQQENYNITTTSPNLRDGDMNGGISPHSMLYSPIGTSISPRSSDASQGSGRQTLQRLTSETESGGSDLGQSNDVGRSRNVGTAPTENGGGEEKTDSEWVEQDEPGVYITLTALTGGGKDLKRVRFSRKRFSERQAEQWWTENRHRVHQQYNVRGIDRSNAGASDYSLSGKEERDTQSSSAHPPA